MGHDPPYRAGVLGATGLVGQTLVARLSVHRWFDLRALAGSDRSAGRPYRESVRGAADRTLDPAVGDAEVRPCEPAALDDCDVVFSALDAAAGRTIEREFARAGFAVVSNSSAHRMAADVPILVPEVNAAHLALVERARAGGGGYVVTNPNCSAAGLVIALAPLHREFGVNRVVVTTMQALSGAGADGPRGIDMLDNVLPWIAGEEDKIETETCKILGDEGVDGVRPAGIAISAHCHRVATRDGHLEAVSVELGRRAGPKDVESTLREFRGDVVHLSLPSSPARVIEVRDEDDRPQPRLDRDAGGGMTVVVGRVRPCRVLDVRFELLSHNLVRGAAGAAVLNAELLAARGLLPRRARA